MRSVKQPISACVKPMNGNLRVLERRTNAYSYGVDTPGKPVLMVQISPPAGHAVGYQSPLGVLTCQLVVEWTRLNGCSLL